MYIHTHTHIIRQKVFVKNLKRESIRKVYWDEILIKSWWMTYMFNKNFWWSYYSCNICLLTLLPHHDQRFFDSLFNKIIFLYLQLKKNYFSKRQFVQILQLTWWYYKLYSILTYIFYFYNKLYYRSFKLVRVY